MEKICRRFAEDLSSATIVFDQDFANRGLIPVRELKLRAKIISFGHDFLAINALFILSDISMINKKPLRIPYTDIKSANRQIKIYLSNL